MIHVKVINPLRVHVAPSVGEQVCFWVSKQDEALIRDATYEFVPFMLDLLLQEKTLGTLGFRIGLMDSAVVVCDMKAASLVKLPVGSSKNGALMRSIQTYDPLHVHSSLADCFPILRFAN